MFREMSSFLKNCFCPPPTHTHTYLLLHAVSKLPRLSEQAGKPKGRKAREGNVACCANWASDLSSRRNHLELSAKVCMSLGYWVKKKRASVLQFINKTKLCSFNRTFQLRRRRRRWKEIKKKVISGTATNSEKYLLEIWCWGGGGERHRTQNIMSKNWKNYWE